MILFQKDWKEKGAAPDYETKNESFLRLCMMLEAMGIKNCVFPLALYDKDLVGVRPKDPNLDAHFQRKIAIECRRNFWYFLREIAVDPKGRDDDPIMFELNRGSCAATFFFFNSILITLIMIRQTGKTFWMQWLATWLKELGVTKTEISYYAQNTKITASAADKIKAMEMALPPYLLMRDPREPANSEVIITSATGNKIQFYVANRSPAIADNLGRGMTAPILLGDEFAYCPNNHITINVVLSAAQAARELARKKGDIFSTVFCTTTGKRDTPEGRYAYDHVMASAIFNEAMYDCRDRDHLEELVRKMSPKKRLHVNITLNHRQLNRDDDWLRARLEDSLQEDPVQIRADYLNEWPSGSTESPFTQEQLETIRQSERSDFYLYVADPENYAFRWYYPRDQIETMLDSEDHILSIDPSEAIGQDGIGIVMRRVTTGEVVMASSINEAILQHFNTWLGRFIVRYKRVTTIIEAKSQGRSVLDYLLVYLPANGEDPFKRLFNQVVQRREDFPDRFLDIQDALYDNSKYAKYKKFFGFGTSAHGETSRTDLFSRTLREATRYTADTVHDRKLILELCGLEIRGNRLDHAAGGHDDVVIGWLLSYWLLSLGRNLYYYGINSSEVLRDNRIRQLSLKETSAYTSHVNHEARRKVEEIYKELSETRDEYYAKRLERELEFAISKLSEQDREAVSFDEMVKTLREERQRHRSSMFDFGSSRYEEDLRTELYSYGDVIH